MTELEKKAVNCESEQRKSAAVSPDPLTALRADDGDDYILHHFASFSSQQSLALNDTVPSGGQLQSNKYQLMFRFVLCIVEMRLQVRIYKATTAIRQFQ